MGEVALVKEKRERETKRVSERKEREGWRTTDRQAGWKIETERGMEGGTNKNQRKYLKNGHAEEQQRGID